MQKPTIQDVAGVAGVSASTVSRVLNSPDFGTTETRNRITKAVKRLNYARLRRRSASVPIHKLDSAALTCPIGASNILFLAPEALLHSIETSAWMFHDVVPALQSYTRKHGLHMILSAYGQDDQSLPRVLHDKQIDGVLWMNLYSKDLLAAVAQTVPTVVLNACFTWPPQTNVQADNRMVLFKGVEHLHELGHQRVALFYCNDRLKMKGHTYERLNAFHEAIDHFGMDADADLCIGERFGVKEHPRAVAKAMDRILAMSSQPTALIAPLTYAIQFLKETRKRAISVPKHLSLIGIDNAGAAELVDPALTVVDCVFARCAEVATDALLAGKTSMNKHTETILLEPTLIVRESTSRPRRTSRLPIPR